MPIAPFLARARHALSFADFPTLFWLGVTDSTLTLGVVAGVILSLLAVAGVRPRIAAALQVVLYLSFATAARTFLSFQWDNLILECGFFAIFLPRDRRSPLDAHALPPDPASSSTGSRASPNGSRTCTTGRTAAP